MGFSPSGSGDQKYEPPREDAQDHDMFILLTLYVIVNSRKDKGKEIKEHIQKDIVLRGFDVRTAEI